VIVLLCVARVLTFQMYEVMINGDSGHLAQVINKVSEVKVRLDQQFLWYWASDGHNANSSQVCVMLYCVC